MQTSLDLSLQSPQGETLAIAGTCSHYYPHCFNSSEADHYLQILVRQVPWRQDTLNFGGRQVLIPRLQAWFGDTGSQYAYSGLSLTPLPWTQYLLEIRQRVESLAETDFNCVLVNYYRDGNDSVSWHSDNERELGPDPIVASVSFGATRRFELKHRTDRNLDKIKCELGHGSVLVMGRGMQQHWQHQVPKQLEIASARINLTFRHIKK